MSEPTFPDLRAFLDELRRRGDLVEIDASVDPHLEAAEIHRRVIAAGGPALLFTNIEGADYPLATNLFGTAARAELAFGKRPLELVESLVELARTAMPPSAGTLWGARSLGRDLLRIGTKTRRSAPVLDVVTRRGDGGGVGLDRLPALTTWAEDGGPFLTLPQVYTEHPDDGGSNLGVYRMQIHDAGSTGMHWQIGKGGGFHYAAAEARGEALPVVVTTGGPPAIILSAIAPLPENVPEIMLASLIAGRKLGVSRLGDSLPILADAEFALVGRVEPGARRPEGPFGDHYGYYSLTHDYPVFEVDALCRRRDAILTGTVVGKPRQEDFYIGDLLQDLLSPLFPLVMPGVEDLWSYGETGYHSLAAAVVRERYAREAMASAFRILGEGQLSLTKFLLVVDRQIDLRDFRAVLEHLLERTDVATDLFVLSNLSMDTLDYTGPKVNEGSKGVWLGLGEARRQLPREFSAERLPAGVGSARVFCGGCLVIDGPSAAEEPGAGARLAADPAFADWPLVVLTDDAARAAASPMNFLWTTFTRFEPGADIHAAGARVARNHVAYEPPILIDARLDPDFPAELFCDPKTADLVTRRWREYFPRDVEMGDSDLAHLDG